MEEELEKLNVLGFGRIADRIRLVWGFPDAADVFTDLMLDQRGGRQGFPLKVFDCISRLFIIHTFPEDKDPWNVDVRVRRKDVDS